MEEWRPGEAQAPSYDATITEARRLFAELVSVPVEWVAVGSQVWALVGIWRQR